MTKKEESQLPQAGDFQSREGSAVDETRKYGYLDLFRYSTACERCVFVFSLLVATASSFFIPYFMIIYGEFTSLLVDRTVAVGTSSPTFALPMFGGGKQLTNASKEENRQAIIDDATAFGIGSLVGSVSMFLLITLAIDLANRIALNQIDRIRKVFLEAMLRQDIAWYDTSSGSNFASKMTEDLDKLKEGIGEKVVIVVFLIMTFVIGIVAAFLYGWKLTLVVLSCVPFIIAATSVVARLQGSLAEKELKAYSNAANVAEEVFSGIRTVFAFSGQEKENARFAKLLIPAEKTGRKKGLYSGMGNALSWLIIYLCMALAIWYGVTLILDQRDLADRTYTPAVLVIVLFAVIMGAQNLGFASPHVEAIAVATAAGQTLFNIIDRASKVDPMDEKGIRPESSTGHIRFEGIHFRYPARPDVEILKGLTVDVLPGQTVAFVGASGCGKSTLIQLVQRFYDPEAGSVKLDGRDLRSLNVGWLRSQIGVVGQEPVLFATTIGENIRYGRPAATQADIEKAARAANCHDFISRLPKGYDTQVGEKGAQISGGQKQRIAIARALVRQPQVLLLDEATSALDPTSEKRVQSALELASEGPTTLVVAHRLSTITNADKIVFLKDGVVAEQGTHEQLMERKGLYCELVNITQRKEATEEDEGAVVGRPLQKSQNLSDEETDDDDDLDDEEEDGEPELQTSGSSRDSGFRASTRRKRRSQRRNKKKKEKEVVPKVSFTQLMKLNSPEWKLILVGSIASVMHGATFPLWGLFFGDFFGILSDGDDEVVRTEVLKISMIFVGIGLMAGLGNMLQTYVFTSAGVKMTSRLRKRAFATIVGQDIAYFDDERNSVGALCSRLASDCSNVQGATGSRVGTMLQAVATLLVGMIIGFVFSWQQTLLTLVTLPLVCLSVYLEGRFIMKSAQKAKASVEEASQVAVEAITNIRTVNGLCLERQVLGQYVEQIDRVDSACRRKVRFRGLVFALGQAAPFLAYGISMYYGGILVADERMDYEDIIKVAEALIFGSWMLGQALAYAPNVNDAILSAGRLMDLFTKTSTQPNPPQSPYNTVEKSEGDIVYENVGFEYPTRKGTPILQGLNLTIKKSTTVALVGPSGSGKSTCVQLLLRYYDPVSGSVNLSGVPSTDFPLDTLRSKLGLVSQEPVLFDRTIAENIAYGNNFRDDVSMQEIIEAAKKSNIHNFVSALPQGYETRLGKTSQLSGGQKQRIAIARALVRNPKILILDEATSALDLESEKVVQQALDEARSGRTCLTIAHRLTTVRNADLICVLKRGVVVEHGTHDELMALNRIYANLYLMQQVAS
ncbi:multidrug resistance protein homolog 49 [Drosophila ficusphila]|uniref:multidrug resistance protein homolog 49 n=1 Tax=Drosophila ficusphila TaxID=30025 RepID=UPI0007E70AE9|nr:multidrug resistance protein homolog 49 [Drosophila ficusphila]XP_017054078.1 multidrug resistance protein homolog 49 [Drosophila ficusphila]XP_017054079.1 multidrug resistance protein homolog 49 [Drosophila ficusphila]